MLNVENYYSLYLLEEKENNLTEEMNRQREPTVITFLIILNYKNALII